MKKDRCKLLGILLKIVSVVVFVGLLTGCGGGETKSTVLRPNPISVEYQGLSMEALSAQASEISYKDIIGETSKGAYTSGNDPKIVENISNHEGVLMLARGWVEKIYPSSEEGVFTVWLCSLDEGVEFSREAGESCIDPIFLLYQLDRGPVLKENDSIVVAGVITGSRTRVTNTMYSNPAWQNVILAPSVSVAKAEFLQSSNTGSSIEK